MPSNAINALGDPQHEGKLMPLSDFMHYGHPVIQNLVAEFSVIIVQRNLFDPQIWAACDYWRALDRLVCADLDDDYPRLTPQNPAYNFWIRDVTGIENRMGLKPVDALKEGLQHVDFLLSPSRLILQDWSDVVAGVHVPNFAHGAWYEGITQKPVPLGDEPIVIGWGGSVSHFDSWWYSGAIEAALGVIEARPQVQFKVCGNDWRLIDHLRHAWPQDRWSHRPGVTPQEWPAEVASLDIGLAPLCGSGAPQSEQYDSRRSWLKAIEYLLCGVPWIGSPGPVYEDLNGRGGVLVQENSPQAWTRAMLEAVDNLEAKKAESAGLMPWAMENLTMNAQAQTLLDTLEILHAEKNARRGFRLPGTVYVADALEKAR